MGVLVGRKAPDFSAKAALQSKIIDGFTLSQFRGKYVILFFYPLDFTFVCPTELHAFEEALSEFEKRNTQVVGCSVDSAFSHQAWLKLPREKGGIQGITYPIVSDLNKTISRDYDVLVPGDGIAYRALFLIDKEGIVRHQIVNDLPLGRSVDEALRVLDALQFFEQNGEVCPANWKAGKRAMQATHDSLEQYVAATLDID
jgi:peroxiredoxin 2/4